jgi:predicted nucleic acid-binding Zn ribbon protein
MSPVYVYSCDKCKKEFDVLQGINDKTLTKHSDATEGHSGLKEVCDGNIKRIIQPCSFSLRGSGWTNKFFRGKKRGKK